LISPSKLLFSARSHNSSGGRLRGQNPGGKGARFIGDSIRLISPLNLLFPAAAAGLIFVPHTAVNCAANAEKSRRVHGEFQIIKSFMAGLMAG